MGASWTKNSWFTGPGSPNKGEGIKANGRSQQKQPRIDPRRLATQFVYTRRGSMYIDEDGDVAHEFYEEVKIGSSQTTTMKKKITNLRPQGNVKYQIPRLHVDFPIPFYSPEK